MSRIFGVLVPALLLATSPAGARDGIQLDDLVHEYHLDNGLTLLVVENHESPTVGLATSFSVGTAEERPGINGVTHILEHMLFKGTTEVGTSDWEAEQVHFDRIEEITAEIKREKAKGRSADEARIEALLAERREAEEAEKRFAVDNELWGLYEEAGGVGLNAFTSYDITAYILALPVNRLELWMYLESARLRRPILRQFYTEVQNVMEERRLGVDSDPEGILTENFLATAFDAHWYGYPIIGYPSDIASLTRTETENWFRRYYAPNRMTITVVGDVEADRIRDQVKEYFGDIPPQAPPEPMETFDLEKRGLRRIEVEFDAEPRLMMGWHKANVPDPGDAALRVISEILTGGRSGRLEKRLVEERQVAASIRTDHEYPGNRWDNLFVVEAEPRAPHTAADLEEAIWEELELLKRQPVTERELQKAKNRIRAARVRELESNLGLAIQLAYHQSGHGDWRVLTEAAAAVEAVTAEDVRRMARETFRRNRTTVATLVKPAFEPDPAREEAGRAIVARVVEALGGREPVNGIRNAHVTADLALHVQGQVMSARSTTLFAVPDRVRSEFTIFGQTAVQCVTGPEGWAERGGQTVDIAGEELAESRADLERDVFLLAYPADDGQYVLQGFPAEDGMEVLEVRGPSGRPFRVHVDAATGLPAKVVFQGKNPMSGQTATVTEELSDFRAVAGVKRPHRIRTLMDGELFADATVTAIRLNDDLAADAFVRPAS